MSLFRHGAAAEPRNDHGNEPSEAEECDEQHDRQEHWLAQVDLLADPGPKLAGNGPGELNSGACPSLLKPLCVRP